MRSEYIETKKKKAMERHTRKMQLIMSTEVGLMQPYAKEHKRLLINHWKLRRGFLQVSDMHSSASTLISNFWPSKLWNNTFLSFKSLLCDTFLWKLWKFINLIMLIIFMCFLIIYISPCVVCLIKYVACVLI